MIDFDFVQIGVIHSPFKQKEGLPIQSVFSKDKGMVDVFEPYLKGLQNLDEFSHIILIYLFHESKPFQLHQKICVQAGKRNGMIY